MTDRPVIVGPDETQRTWSAALSRALGAVPGTRSRPQTRLSALFITADLIAIGLSLVFSGLFAAGFTYLFFERFYLENGLPGGIERIIYVSVLTVGVVFALAVRGHYRCGLPLHRELQQVVGVLALALIVEGFLHYAQKEDFSRLWLFSTWLFAIPLMLIGRALVKMFVMRHEDWRVPVVIVGTEASIDDALTLFEMEYQLGFRSVSKIVTEEDMPFRARDFDELKQSVAPWSGAHVVFAQPFGAESEFRAALRFLNTNQIPYSMLTQFHEMSVMNAEISPLYRNEMVLISQRVGEMQMLADAIKRMTDIVFAMMMLILMLPLMLIVSLIVSSDGGPVIYRHARIGRFGQEFYCLKFRTMLTDSEEVLDRYLAENSDAAQEWEEQRKLDHDPRVTVIGHWLRRLSLDELPQLFNILRGEMSIVGPRPVTEDELARYGDNLDYYLSLRPGVTGLWQISGRSSTTYERRVYLDGWYARNKSFWHDMAIILRTVPAVISSKGAI